MWCAFLCFCRSYVEPCKRLSEQRIHSVSWLKAHSDAMIISSLWLGDNPPIWFGSTGYQGKQTTKHTQLMSGWVVFVLLSIDLQSYDLQSYDDKNCLRIVRENTEQMNQKPWVHTAQVNIANRRRRGWQMERGWRQYKMEYVQSEGWTCTICKMNGRNHLRRKITRATKINKKKAQSKRAAQSTHQADVPSSVKIIRTTWILVTASGKRIINFN